MQIKTISCERVINLGNYESRRLQLGAEISPDEDVETAITSLMELVERKSRESFELMFDVRELKRERRQLTEEVAKLKTEKDKLTGEEKPNSEEPDINDIPFDAGEASTTNDASLTSEQIAEYF
ncbi:hypothetical protein NIES2100_21170 [Calothrix sp. NIES-2100]|uniref:hypothetical protein n=1 Tax=Calothrix sp. NIES-2100 TaxID=1954172 RepID=UPI000B5F53F4|nr:hypothetical protein NIES2100_21170 [Calothrix sp. NIES-2100]